jgi:hypothetical protein
VQAATKKLSVSAILFGILAGIIGIVAGLRRILFPNFAASLRLKISRRHRQNFPAQAAGQSNEGEISRLV